MSSDPNRRDTHHVIVKVLATAGAWLLLLLALAMAGSGHAMWSILGASSLRVGLLHAIALCTAADATFACVISSKMGERARIVLGFFVIAGLLLSVAAFAAIREAWVTGL